jgi:hypothetical protein
MDVLSHRSRRALCGGLLVVASASCEWITPLDFVGNGVDAQTLVPEAGGSGAEASSVTGATDGALNTGDGSTFDADSCDPAKAAGDPSMCGVCGHTCYGGTRCGCHSEPPGDEGSADGGASDAKADAASSSSDSSTSPPPANLIANGDFAQGTMHWAIVGGMASEGIVAGDLCVDVAAASDTRIIVLSWPAAAGAGVPLSATGSYTFSYGAHATKADVTVNATVGDSVGPHYLPIDFESKTDLVTTAATTFTHPFTPAGGADTSAGLSFSFVSHVAQSVCFANVSLVEK